MIKQASLTRKECSKVGAQKATVAPSEQCLPRSTVVADVAPLTLCGVAKATVHGPRALPSAPSPNCLAVLLRSAD